MTVGEAIKEYRLQHSLSQRQFAQKCGLSNGYISMLEDNNNPKTGMPMIPSIATLRKIAHAMNISLDDLMAIAADAPITLEKDESALSDRPDIEDITRILQTLSPAKLRLIRALVQEIAESEE